MYSLIKKLPKMPFPAKSKAEDLDYTSSKLLQRDLHQKLVTASQGMASLRDQIREQKVALG